MKIEKDGSIAKQEFFLQLSTNYFIRRLPSGTWKTFFYLTNVETVRFAGSELLRATNLCWYAAEYREISLVWNFDGKLHRGVGKSIRLITKRMSAEKKYVGLISRIQRYQSGNPVVFSGNERECASIFGNKLTRPNREKVLDPNFERSECCFHDDLDLWADALIFYEVLMANLAVKNARQTNITTAAPWIGTKSSEDQIYNPLIHFFFRRTLCRPTGWEEEDDLSSFFHHRPSPLYY